MNSFFLSVSFPRTRREVPSIAGRKGQVCVHRSKFLMYLLQFAPSVNLTVDTLAKGKESHSLLQHRFAPRKVVRLLPDKRGRLAIPIFYFLSYELYLLCFIFCRASSASLKVIFLSGLWIRRERRIRLWSGASVFWKIASLCFCIHFSRADA